MIIYSCPVVIGGDFNVRFQIADDPECRRLRDVLSSFDMVQHVSGATHRCGNTLELFITFAGCESDAVDVDPVGIILDHALVVSRLPVTVSSPTTAERLVRGWRRVDRNEIRRLLEVSPLCQPVSDDRCRPTIRDLRRGAARHRGQTGTGALYPPSPRPTDAVVRR